jgi:hypothetical protein
MGALGVSVLWDTHWIQLELPVEMRMSVPRGTPADRAVVLMLWVDLNVNVILDLHQQEMVDVKILMNALRTLTCVPSAARTLRAPSGAPVPKVTVCQQMAFTVRMLMSVEHQLTTVDMHARIL